MKKTQRVLAIIGVIILLSFYVISFITAITATEESHNWFVASVGATIFVPVVLYAYNILVRTTQNKEEESRQREAAYMEMIKAQIRKKKEEEAALQAQMAQMPQAGGASMQQGRQQAGGVPIQQSRQQAGGMPIQQSQPQSMSYVQGETQGEWQEEQLRQQEEQMRILQAQVQQLEQQKAQLEQQMYQSQPTYQEQSMQQGYQPQGQPVQQGYQPQSQPMQQMYQTQQDQAGWESE